MLLPGSYDASIQLSVYCRDDDWLDDAIGSVLFGVASGCVGEHEIEYCSLLSRLAIDLVETELALDQADHRLVEIIASINKWLTWIASITSVRWFVSAFTSVFNDLRDVA